jgi:hypothetical protein
MQPRAQGVFDTIKRAFDSSLNGQIHQGDLVGIWTFNELLFQELFPTQAWSQPTQLAFAVRLPTFAEPKLYQKRARLDKVVPEILKVMAGNENVTIILITTGEGALEETPFCAQISLAWKEWHDEQEGVHMPLQTVLRAINGKPIDWFVTPAPRPIQLAKPTIDPQQAQEKERNPAGVVLESGLVTNRSAAGEAEQQVAFSVWDLGKTGLMASATSPQKISTPEPRPADSTPPAADSSTNMPINQLSSTTTTHAEPSKAASAVVAPKDVSTEGDALRIANDAPTVTSSSNAANTDKPVELVFVTNAPAQPAPVAETVVKEITPATTPASASAPPAPSSFPDLPANHQQILAHARAADPSQEEKNDLALATPRRGFLRENIQPLLLMIVAGFGAVYCFKMWFRTNTRTKGNVFSLTRTEPDESLRQEP